MRLVKAVPRRRRWCGDTSARATERFSRYRGGTLRIQLSALTSGRPTHAVESSKSVGCNPLKALPFKFWAAQRREFASPSQGVKRSPQRNEESCCWASDIYLKSLICWAEFGTSSCLFFFYIFFHIHMSYRQGRRRGQATSGCHGVAVGKRECKWS